MVRLLKNASISFHTNDEDKDHDTHVTVTVRDVNGLVCAQVDNDWGHFDDHTDAGPFGLVIRNRQTADLLQSGTLNIHIDPNGHDTWRFNFNLVLTFGDGTTLAGGQQGLQLSQSSRDLTDGLEGLLNTTTTGDSLTIGLRKVHVASPIGADLVLDVPESKTHPGTPVQTYPRNDPPTANQLWIVTRDGYIESALSPNLVLDAAGAIAKPGTPVNIWTKNTPRTPNQQWSVTPDGFIVSAMDRNLVLDLPASNSNPGTHVQIWTRDQPRAPNQIWALE